VQYGAALPQLARKLDAALRSTCSREVVLKSVHEAKGGEWPHVYVHSDLSRPRASAHTAEGEDGMYRLNLAYVAMKRATTVLFLPSAMVTSWLHTTDVGLPNRASRVLGETDIDA
jgi:superfamily I DNA/RNA helicase